MMSMANEMCCCKIVTLVWGSKFGRPNLQVIGGWDSLQYNPIQAIPAYLYQSHACSFFTHHVECALPLWLMASLSDLHVIQIWSGCTNQVAQMCDCLVACKPEYYYSGMVRLYQVAQMCDCLVVICRWQQYDELANLLHDFWMTS